MSVLLTYIIKSFVLYIMFTNWFKNEKTNKQTKTDSSAYLKLQKRYPVDSIELNLEGYKTDANVVSVYDGDSLTMVFGTPFTKKQAFTWKCRVDGLDTPEIKTRNLLEKKAGYKVKAFVEMLVKVAKIKGNIKVECKDYDKFGRVLIDLYLNGTNLKYILIEKGYAMAYDGGTKEKWTDEQLEYILNN